MWKLIVGFILFAALALVILTKSGGDVDLGGEKHNIEAPDATKTPAPIPPAGSAGKP